MTWLEASQPVDSVEHSLSALVSGFENKITVLSRSYHCSSLLSRHKTNDDLQWHHDGFGCHLVHSKKRASLKRESIFIHSCFDEPLPNL